MDKETVTLIAAVIAACAALATTALTSWRAYRLEEVKWRRALQDEADRAVRVAIADLAKHLAVAQQAVSWLTWKARNAQESLTIEDIVEYNKDMKDLFPNLVSAHLLVVALDQHRDTKIKPLIQRLYALDERVALAAVKLNVETARAEGVAMLQACYADSLALSSELHAKLASAMYPTDTTAATQQ